MTVCVFSGPSLLPADRRGDIVWLPPVRQGDVYRVTRRGPRVVGLIDGYFDGVPAVWHKEILYALERGIHVLGAASMGALRAAELERFGMRGVGEVFQAFRDGLLTDDDEVAVLHGPAEAGYPPASVAMVDLRATLAAARDAGIMSAATHATLVSRAKGTFYQDRDWAPLLASDGSPAAELAALRAWLPTNRVDRKRLDALALLAAIDDLLAADPPPARLAGRLEWTVAFDELAAESDEPDPVLDELRLDPALLAAARERAAGRLALDPALEALMLEVLREDGAYEQLAARARDKAAVLAAHGVDPRDSDGPPPPVLLAWYFEERLKRRIPNDINWYLHAHGFADREDFYSTLLRDWLYSHHKSSAGG